MKNRFLFLALLFVTNAACAQDVFFTKPYLQIGNQPAPGSMVLVWHTVDLQKSWSVEYRNNDKDNWHTTAAPSFTTVAVTGITPHRVYHANISGLEPGNVFNYRVLQNGKIVFTSTGNAIKNAQQPYRFVAMGDIGAETPDQKALATRAYLARPDFLVVPGDIVYENGLISEYRTKFWPVYNADKTDSAGAPLMRSIPFIAAVGNHDASSRDLDKNPGALAYYMYWDQPLNGPTGEEGGPLLPVLKGSPANKNAFLLAAGDAYPRMNNFSFNYGNAHWTVLDADPYTDWTSKALTDWVAKDLDDSKNAVWHFVMFHHPGFNSSREHFEQQQMRTLSPIFEKGKVDIVFNGHVHNYQRSLPMRFVPDNNGIILWGGKDGKTNRGKIVNGQWKLDKTFDGKTNTSPNGIIYIITGAGGQELYNPEQENDPDSWQKFTAAFVSTVHSLTIADVNGKTITLRQLNTEGKELDAFTITK